MRNLIVGCGYLGRRVADIWMQHGLHVAALTRSLARGQELSVAGIEPCLGDVLRPDLLQALPEAHTVLYAVGYDRQASAGMREVYVAGLRNVLAQVAGRVERFLYVSSTSVYGQSQGEWVDEESACVPARENGRVCLDAEQVLSEFPQVPSIVLRSAGLYGPGRLLSRLESLRAGEPLPGNPQAWLNLIHVEDAARAAIACGGGPLSRGLYLLCDDRPVRRAEYYASLAALSGAPPPRYAEAAGEVADLNKRCSNQKLRRELGLELRYPSITEGLPASL